MNKELMNTQWKLLANNKKLTADHFFQRAILIAIGAKNKKNVPREDIALSLLQKYFSRGSTIRRIAKRYSEISKYRNTMNIKLLDLPSESFLSKDELNQFFDIIQNLNLDKIGRKYIYYFTIQDGLTPEQQGVQAGHSLFALGTKLGKEYADQANNIYFQWIGVKTSSDLLKIIEKHNLPHVKFYEPDHGNILTSIAFYPILWNMREEFLDYPLLTH